MKIDYTKEILLCFKLQYSLRYERYIDFFQEPIPKSLKRMTYKILVYCDMVGDMNLIIDLIRGIRKNGTSN